ncbi:MAG: Kae1-associated serine/threonine protein kinase [Thermoplasmata archaeon]|nr:Kae1-associated serine/threonine protein kinase [Thermoplasmata archaeon]
MMIRKGAEAEIHLTVWLDTQIIAKRRVPKNYRLETLDRVLRTRRTKMEAKLMAEARAIGISTPLIYDIDTENSEIIMEYIDGPRVKDVLNQMSASQRRKVCFEIGSAIGKLHDNNIIHGDLTTSNILYIDDKIYFIDFSLGEISEEIESKGVDLHVLMEAYESTHPGILDDFEYIMKGYRTEFQDAPEVEAKIQAIIDRGRYT